MEKIRFIKTISCQSFCFESIFTRRKVNVKVILPQNGFCFLLYLHHTCSGFPVLGYIVFALVYFYLCSSLFCSIIPVLGYVVLVLLCYTCARICRPCSALYVCSEMSSLLCSVIPVLGYVVLALLCYTCSRTCRPCCGLVGRQLRACSCWPAPPPAHGTGQAAQPAAPSQSIIIKITICPNLLPVALSYCFIL